jgi:DNA (cytosine-5)-methyltransferase 1
MSNTSKRKSPPTAAAVRAARSAAGLTQSEAARLIYSTLRTFQCWEGGERVMHPALFELFLLKTGQLHA